MASAAIAAKAVEVFRDLALSTGNLRRRTYEVLLDVNKALDRTDKSLKATNADRLKVLKDILGNNLKSAQSAAWIAACEKKEASVSKVNALITLVATPTDDAFAKVQEDYYQGAIALKLCSLDEDTNFSLSVKTITILDDTIEFCKYAIGYAQTTIAIAREDKQDNYNHTVADLVETQVNQLRELYDDAYHARNRYSQDYDNVFRKHGYELVDNTIRIIKLESATYRLIEAFKNLNKYCG